jgi:hypothetical protein
MNEKFSILTELNYEKIVEQLDPVEVRTFLTLFPPDKQPDPRTIVEGVADGLGLTDDHIKGQIGLTSWMKISSGREVLTAAYRGFDTATVEATLRSLRPPTRESYRTYPKYMIALYGKGHYVGGDTKYLELKVEMMTALMSPSNGSMAGQMIRRFRKYLEKYYRSAMDPRNEMSSTEFIEGQNRVAKAMKKLYAEADRHPRGSSRLFPFY